MSSIDRLELECRCLFERWKDTEQPMTRNSYVNLMNAEFRARSLFRLTYVTVTVAATGMKTSTAITGVITKVCMVVYEGECSFCATVVRYCTTSPINLEASMAFTICDPASPASHPLAAIAVPERFKIL